MRDTEPGELAAALERITPARLVSQVVPIDGTEDLFEIEARGIADAVARRRREFAAGRGAARRALGLLGIPPTPIPRADDRRPIWPRGIVGSISHAEGFAAAIVGRDEAFAGVGLDIEAAVPLASDLHRHILTPTELRACAAAPMVGGAPRCMAAFVAKEALYKAIYPITRRFFGFQDALVESFEDGTWSAVLADPPAFPRPGFRVVEGRWVTVGGMIAATVCVASSDDRAG